MQLGKHNSLWALLFRDIHFNLQTTLAPHLLHCCRLSRQPLRHHRNLSPRPALPAGVTIMADNTDPGHVPKGHPWETAVTVKQEWASKDVELASPSSFT